MNLPKPSLAATVRKINSISTLPHIAIKIIEITSNPKSSAADLEEVIKSDPGLTAKILKAANSAHFGLREQVMEVRKAVVFMGFKTVKDLALGASVCEMFKNNQPIGHYTRSGLWRHSVGVAITAKVIASKTDRNFSEFIFSTGILHDIGIVMMDQYLHEYFVASLGHPNILAKGLHNVETEIMGFNHQDLAREVVSGWGLPNEFIQAVAFHHNPNRGESTYKGLLACLYLANALCDSRRFGYAEAPKIQPGEFNYALSCLNFTKTDVQVILEELPAEFEKALDLINMVDT